MIKREPAVYPPIVFEHLETLTDSTGVIQHAIFSIPNRRTGYTTDDNIRALIAAIMEFASVPVLVRRFNLSTSF